MNFLNDTITTLQFLAQRQNPEDKTSKSQVVFATDNGNYTITINMIRLTSDQKTWSVFAEYKGVGKTYAEAVTVLFNKLRETIFNRYTQDGQIIAIADKNIGSMLVASNKKEEAVENSFQLSTIR